MSEPQQPQPEPKPSSRPQGGDRGGELEHGGPFTDPETPVAGVAYPEVEVGGSLEQTERDVVRIDKTNLTPGKSSLKFTLQWGDKKFELTAAHAAVILGTPIFAALVLAIAMDQPIGYFLAFAVVVLVDLPVAWRLRPKDFGGTPDESNDAGPTPTP